MDFTRCEDDQRDLQTASSVLMENSINKNDDLNSDSQNTDMVSMTNDLTKVVLESEETCSEEVGSSYSTATPPSLDQSYTVSIMSKDSKIAIVCCDEDSCVVVTDINWFRIGKSKPDWSKDVVTILLELQVKTVIANGLMTYKKMALNWPKTLYIEHNDRLKYPCGMCNKKSCAVQRAYLTWKRCLKRTRCFLEH